MKNEIIVLITAGIFMFAATQIRSILFGRTADPDKTSPEIFIHWLNDPVHYNILKDAVEITSGPGTDYFVDSISDYKKANAPIFALDVSSDFTFSCRVEPEFKTKYDAGTIMLYYNDSNWIKLGFEMTDLGYPSIVSVVTKEKSDDCNGERINGRSIYLQVSKKNDIIGLYYSPDETHWKMVRLFEFKNKEGIPCKIGISAQSPANGGCTVKFSSFRYKKSAVTEFRQGI